MNDNHSIFKDEMAQMQITRIAILFTLTILLMACGDPVQDQINAQIPLTEQRVQQLGNMLDADEVRNAKLIKQYADHIRGKSGQHAQLADEFSKDATSKGPLFLALLDRVNTVKSQPQMFASSQARFEELLNIYQAADPVLFSDALSDPLNVLADMSGGELPRVNAMSKAQSLAANKAQDFGVGEQLIGNPAYGEWQTDNNGMSFWMWYGMYRILDDVLDIDDVFERKRKRRIYYNQWGRSRNYSYYHDYGRTRYSSPTQLKKQNTIENRTRKSFQNKGFSSAYGKNRSGASGVSSQSRTAQSSANRFKSSSTKKSTYAKKTTTSKYSKSASLRNSSSSTSRGFRRGK